MKYFNIVLCGLLVLHNNVARSMDEKPQLTEAKITLEQKEKLVKEGKKDLKKSNSDRKSVSPRDSKDDSFSSNETSEEEEDTSVTTTITTNISSSTASISINSDQDISLPPSRENNNYNTDTIPTASTSFSFSLPEFSSLLPASWTHTEKKPVCADGMTATVVELDDGKMPLLEGEGDDLLHNNSASAFSQNNNTANTDPEHIQTPLDGIRVQSSNDPYTPGLVGGNNIINTSGAPQIVYLSNTTSTAEQVQLKTDKMTVELQNEALQKSMLEERKAQQTEELKIGLDLLQQQLKSKNTQIIQEQEQHNASMRVLQNQLAKLQKEDSYLHFIIIHSLKGASETAGAVVGQRIGTRAADLLDWTLSKTLSTLVYSKQMLHKQYCTLRGLPEPEEAPHSLTLEEQQQIIQIMQKQREAEQQEIFATLQGFAQRGAQLDDAYKKAVLLQDENLKQQTSDVMRNEVIGTLQFINGLQVQHQQEIEQARKAFLQKQRNQIRITPKPNPYSKNNSSSATS